jgi:hypothetical protein
MHQAKRYALGTESIDLCANHVCLSARDSAKWSPKESKEDKGRNIEKVLDCATLDGPMPPTRQSSVHWIVRCMVRPTMRSQKFLPMSAIIHRTVRTRRRTVRWASGQQLVATPALGQRSTGAPGQSSAPGSRNQPIRGFSTASSACTIHCPVCTGHSGAPADRRQQWPSKWSSNGS